MKILHEESEIPKKQDELLALIRETSIPGAVTYHYERPNNFGDFAKTQGTHFQLWEAIENDSLLGFTQITFDQVIWNNNPVTISYSGDTRISPKAKGRNISDSLIHAACNQNVPVFGAVLGTNKLVLEKKLKDWAKLGVYFKEFAKLKAILYTPTPNKKTVPNLLCRNANESDLPAMFHLWKIYSNTRNLSRYYSNQDAFNQAYFQTPGINLEHTLLVFDGVSLIGMLSLWDQSEIRKMIVDQKNVWMKVASRFIALPDPGEELKVLYSFQHACLDHHHRASSCMKLLISRARSQAHALNAHFFSFGLDAQDPMFPLARKSAVAVNTVKMILDSRGNEDFTVSNKPLHLEVGMG